MITVAELRKALDGLGPGMKVGVAGHFGEYNEFNCLPSVREGGAYHGKPDPPWLAFEHVYIGEEPE